MSVTRYTVGLQNGSFVCEINPNGGWVDYDEHTARCQEINDKWALENQALAVALKLLDSAQKTPTKRGTDGFCHTCASYTCSACEAAPPYPLCGST